MARSRRKSKSSSAFISDELSPRETPVQRSSSRRGNSLSALITTLPLLLLSYLPIAAASEVSEGLELSSSTWYQFSYAMEAFSGLAVKLIEVCGIAFSGNVPPGTTFEYAGTPQCTLNGIPGPGIDIGVEAGKNFTASLVDCMNRIMVDLCRDYYNNHPSNGGNSNGNDNTALIVFGVLAGVVLLACCVAVMMACCCGHAHSSHHSSSYSSGYSNGYSSGATTGIATIGLLGALAGGSHHHHGYGTGGSSGSSHNNVGVSWNFGKSPV